MATIKEILGEFNSHKPRFYAIRTNNGWIVKDNKADANFAPVARDTDGEKIARLVKLLNGASDVNE